MSSTVNRLSTQKQSTLGQWQTTLLSLFVLLAWGWLFRPIFPYLKHIFTNNDFRTNQVLLFLVVGLIAQQVYDQKLQKEFYLGGPVYRKGPLLVALGSAITFLLVKRFLDVNTLAASFFAFGSYGLLGFWVRPRRWRMGLPAALLIMLTLPFGHHMQTFIGYPMRIATAAIVRDVLSMAGIGHVGIDTILILENGVSHIDLPCSGVQSLWTGTMFLLAATWLEEKRIGVRWLLTIGVLMLLLFLANLVRVVILTLVGSVLGWSLLAEMLHVPLGVIGFVLACGVALWLLKMLPLSAEKVSSSHLSQEGSEASASVHPLLITCLFVGLSFFYAERVMDGLGLAAPNWVFDADVAIEAFPLNAYEAGMLTRDGAESAERMTFQSGDLSGSMIIVTSSTWRAHHSPERCFEVYGLSIDKSTTHLVDQTFPLRLVSLGAGTYTANYWFQSIDTTTDDYATRIWDDIRRERNRWVLVSMIFDEGVDVNSAEVEAFYRTIHTTVADTLNGG